MRILIKGSHAFLEEYNKCMVCDLLIEEGRIAKIASQINDQKAKVIQLDRRIYSVIPGLIDLHCHLREPGQTQKETIKTGTLAAAKGGYTRVVAMGNTTPPMSTVKTYEETLAIIKRDACISVTQAGTITKNLEGKELSEAFVQNVSSVYSDDGQGIQSIELMREAISWAKKNKSLLILHEENKQNTDLNVEASHIKRDLQISKEVSYPLHFTHVSSQESVDLLTKANELGNSFTADTTPHHIFFSVHDLFPGDTSFKVNPPILSIDDKRSLLEAIYMKIIQYIATDHAPHTKDEKSNPWDQAPYGISGFETSFAASYTALHRSNYPNLRLTINRLIPLFTSNPARLLGIFNEEGSITVGKKANLTIIDRKHEKKVLEADLISKGKNTPFIGKKLVGWPVLTIFEGEVIYEDISRGLYRK